MKKNNNIITFKDIDEFYQFLRTKLLLKKLGNSSEGSCYLSYQDNLAYKILEYSLFEAVSNTHKLSEIITTKDINLKSFAFPQELYSISQKLVGYKTEYITPDLFNYNDLIMKPESIYRINFNSLKTSYDKMLKDVEKLSQENIKIIDLPCNLMFTGKRLVGIDTCFYRREEVNPLDYNIESLNASIKEVFEPWILFNLNEPERTEYLNSNAQDIIEYLNGVNKIITKVKKRIK